MRFISLFVADRAGRGTDVLIDMCGALASSSYYMGIKEHKGKDNNGLCDRDSAGGSGYVPFPVAFLERI